MAETDEATKTKDSYLHININGTDLAYQDIGKGKPLVLVHPSISDIRSLDAVAKEFAKHFRVITYSRRYAWPNEPIKDGVADQWEEHAEDLATMIQMLDIAPAHVLGNSSGATVALLLARKRPDLVASLIQEEPPVITLFITNLPPSISDMLGLLWYHPWSFVPVAHFGAAVIGPTTAAFKKGDEETALKTFARGVLGDEYLSKLSEARREQMRVNFKPLGALLCYGQLPRFLESDVKKIELPVLVLSAEKTVPAHKHINDRLAALLPNSQLVVVPNASHMIHEDCPEIVVREVVKFISGLSSTDQ